MIKKIAFCFTLLLLISFTITNNFRDLVLEKLEAYANDFPEKVYVQTDKPYYASGENIWYTAYLVNGINHKVSDKSRVIYVELINEKDSILSKKQLYTNDISVAGDFKINDRWKPGNYILRAYTSYMRNKNSDYFFQKQIPIWGLKKSDSLSTNPINLNENLVKEEVLTERPEINFYPESGYLVNGITSKVGIKVKDKLNRSIIIKGVIKDSDDKIISSFKTFQFGLGTIILQPKPNKNYYASVVINNKEVKYPLPKALPSGYNLSIANNGSSIIIKSSTNNPIGLKNTFLVAHQRGNLVYEKLETESINTYSIKLNSNILNDGVTSFTLFNSDGNPVCERLVYIDNPENDVSVIVNSNNTTPKTRDKVTLKIDLKDKQGNNVKGNLSMSITDIDAIDHSSKNENIKTYLLLNSDLRGTIEDPGYFFEKENDPKRRYLLDLVMLTHGWRRFTWNELLYKKEKNEAYKPEKGIYISGYTTALKESSKNISTATRLTLMGSDPYQEKKQSDVNGAFKFGPYVFNDTMPTLIEARVKGFEPDKDRKNRFVKIHLDEHFYDSPKVARKVVLKPKSNDKTKITNFLKQSQSIFKIDSEFLENARLLDEVVIEATRKTEKEKRNKLLNSRGNYGSPSHRIDMNDYENQENLSILNLLNTLPGVNVFNDRISIRNGGTPVIVLDNVPVEFSDIIYLLGSDIEFIDVLKGADAAFFANSANGVIAIYSRTGANIRTRNIKRKPGIIDFISTGFYTAREFYAPNHLNGFDEAIKQDLRVTLHWEPKITLNNSTKTEVSFFTSDTRSNYAIKIEGITTEGTPVYHLSTFEVD